MDSLGSEIGQKMRSAVKAKLIELGTGTATGYIDDELPDYVMIMVANKRSRQQMVDDLTLFLGTQTEVFVNWLHQVLQKLEEVTLPATSSAAAAASGGDKATKAGKEAPGKRKTSEKSDKKDKKKDKKAKKRDKTPEAKDKAGEEDHTPPHPSQLTGGVSSIQDVFANQFIQHAKKTMDVEGNVAKKDPRESTPPMRDNSSSRTGNEFDIPTISEIAGQSALSKHQKELSELEEIQQKIKLAKKQLKSMGSDESEDEDFLNIKANDEDLENIEDGGLAAAAKRKERRKISIEQETAREEQEERSNTPPPPPVSATTPPKKKSIMERLGIRPEPAKPTPAESATKEPTTATNKSNIISLSAHRREERELYVPVFRRKEMEEQAKAREARARLHRSRSRERDRRRSPLGRSGRKDNSRSSRDRSRSRRERERERERIRDRSRSRDRGRERERDRDRSSGRINNGTDVRARIGSRVIVLPPKPEYNEEDEVEVPIPSVVKIQPRPQVPKSKQPSKNLLLKAMAEAQRSTAANLKKTINNREESSSRHHRMLIEIPGATKSEGTPPVDVRYEYEEEDDDEDIVEHVLRDDDVDAELEEILNANDEYIPEPVTVTTAVVRRSESDSDGYVYVPAKKPSDGGALSDEYETKDPTKKPKFVVTLDGAYRKSSRTSPSHTPPPPSSKSKPSIKDRIGQKVPKTEPGTVTPPPQRNREASVDRAAHQEALKRRKERFSIKTPSKDTSKSPDKRSKSSSSKKSPSKREKRSSHHHSNNRKSSPTTSDLNELLLQRTKELLVDDSVSSSPIYMSKSDYEKIEPNSSSRKRKRVSPIQFALTDDDEDGEDTDGEYNHHRDRDHRERKSIERILPSGGGGGLGEEDVRKDRGRDRDAERRTVDDDRRKNLSSTSGNGDSKSPSKRIKRLESSRKFDDIPQLLSSVAVPSEGLLSKSKAIIKERCKYFPLCRQGDSCEFLHPSTNCKAFPACKFGDKCLYLHPMCKYDKTCHRLDCNYMHTKPLSAHVSTAPPLASSVVPVQNYKTITAKPLPQPCRFYPGCSNGDLCPYYHPKLCRFGRHCMNKVECNFYHYDLPGGGAPLDHHEAPPKDKFKWVSPFSA